jgi:hypothetical protein
MNKGWSYGFRVEGAHLGDEGKERAWGSSFEHMMPG